MAIEPRAPRSRRALLAAAVGSAAAVAASAALPLTAAAADPNDVVKETDNATTAETSITNSGADSTAFAGNATGTGFGYGLEGTSAGAAGVFGWSITAPAWDPPFTADVTSHTGVFGSSPAGDHLTTYGTGVWGDSPDTGVYGTGSYGVEGLGTVGVAGWAFNSPGTVGVWAYAPTTASIGLRVTGKVQFSRSGRQSMSSGRASVTKYLAGVTSTSKVFAVLSTSESGRWVRAVVPAAGKFTVYLNTALTSSAVVSWFVLD
jgi:hypothetical protein